MRPLRTEVAGAGSPAHWVIDNTPGCASKLPQAERQMETLLDGAQQGIADFGKIGYSGPCPPRGETHRYLFTLYAVNAKVKLKAGAAARKVEQAIKGHTLAQAPFVGRYKRGQR